MSFRRMPQRFLEGAPNSVYDVFDNPNFADRYTVVYRPSFEGVPYASMSDNPESPNGVNIIDTMTPRKFRGYREGNRKNRISWNDLPARVKVAVIRDLEEWNF